MIDRSAGQTKNARQKGSTPSPTSSTRVSGRPVTDETRRDTTGHDKQTLKLPFRSFRTECHTHTHTHASEHTSTTVTFHVADSNERQCRQCRSKNQLSATARVSSGCREARRERTKGNNVADVATVHRSPHACVHGRPAGDTVSTKSQSRFPFQ